MSAARIQVHLLGPVTIQIDGSPLAVDTRKAIALLAFLVATRRPASREAVAALLWPEADGPDARGALRRTLSVLKAGLGDPGLIVDRSAVVLDTLAFDVDLWRFEEALAAARGHRHSGNELCADCLWALQAAAALDRGEFMAGFALRDSEEFDEWQLGEASSHRRRLSAVLERLARGQAAARAWDSAASAARRWLELDPLHEPAHRLLMEILARSGEPAAALAQYRDCVRILDRELGIAPLAETVDLAEAIRTGELSADREAVAAPTPARSTGAGLVGNEPATGTGEGPARPPIVGRNVELASLTEAIDGIGPAGRFLVIEGEPGIGKTRLAAAVTEAVRERAGIALESRGYAGESAIPLSMIAELVRAGMAHPDASARLQDVDPASLSVVARLVPIPGVIPIGVPRDGDPFGRIRLFDALAAVLDALVRGPHPGILWIDDLHLADASTLEFLGYLAHRLADHPLGLLVTWRAEDLDPISRERLLAHPGIGVPTRVTLGRLARPDVAVLAGAVLGSPPGQTRIDALFEGSEGLPLYIIEALAEPDSSFTTTPGGVQALLRARISSVSEVGRQILAAAAVIGRSFDPDLVRATSGRSDEETVESLEELIRRGLVREVETAGTDEPRLDFTHASLRDVAYESLSLVRRRLLHARVAGALAHSPSPAGVGGVRWSLIAYHETLAGGTEAAAEAHRRAGDDARSIFANEEAREHLEAALGLGHPAVAELRTSLAEVLTLLGDYEGALSHLESASALAGPEQQAAIEYRMGQVYARRGDWARADRHLAAALAANDDPAMRSRMLVDRSAVIGRSGDPDGAERFAREAHNLAEAGGDLIGVARALDLLGILARRKGDLAAARAVLERAISIGAAAEARDAAGPAVDPGVRIAALNTLALVCADEGDTTKAIELTRDALERCARQGDRHRQAALENNLADLLQRTGRLDEAMDHLKRAVSLFAEIGGRPGELEPEIWKLVEW
ncbi:MAG: ATP-binding protein [Candidatus Limnocylindrales bacterium]